MARKSRNPYNQPTKKDVEVPKYIAGAYIRVSDTNHDSVEGQHLIITDYLAQHKDIILYDVYIDDGKSSFNVRRPRYDDLLDDAKKGVINCIIIKDFSRLNRDYLNIGYLLRVVFPSLNIRLIAVASQYDSLNATRIVNFRTSLQNIVSSSYSKDLSSKVKSTIRMQQLTGKYIAAALPYGYVKQSNKNGTEFLPDEKSSSIVQLIFSMAEEGRSAYVFAGRLNDLEIPSPSEHKDISYKALKLWNRQTVQAILRNRFYTGALVMGKTHSEQIRHPRKVAADEWCVINQHHPALISLDQYNRVQDILTNRRTNSLKENPQSISPGGQEFLGKALYCKVCGCKMHRRVWSGKTYFICSTYENAKGSCILNSIAADVLQADLYEEYLHRLDAAKKIKNQVNYLFNSTAFRPRWMRLTK